MPEYLLTTNNAAVRHYKEVHDVLADFGGQMEDLYAMAHVITRTSYELDDGDDTEARIIRTMGRKILAMANELGELADNKRDKIANKLCAARDAKLGVGDQEKEVE